eukprot:TRINITY_DN13825_c0_g1_i5.p1 TRINITY_DN13825_c0_g1~~TRINITY_DN13825_c0_g1_i5.p1  ORF type:complete len:205 (+),score=46.30 TRINITY_DN13825_c0_g1_i5:65-616(+)
MWCGGEEMIEPRDENVYLNIYDITWANNVLGMVGWGAYHTGVEIYGEEIGFGRSTDERGVYKIPPRSYEGHTFKKSLYLGTTSLTREDVGKAVATMRDVTWASSKYHLVHTNCNDFSEALCRELLPHIPQAFPLWINRPCRMSSALLPTYLSEKVNDVDKNIFMQYASGATVIEEEEEEDERR